MTEQVNREKLLEVAREFYTGDIVENYIENGLRQKSPMVTYVYNKVVETLKADWPGRSFQLGSKDTYTLQRSIFRVLKGSYCFCSMR